MTRLLALLAVAAVGVVPASSWAADGSLEPDVASVVSGGVWEDQDRHGHYRVIVRSAGFEHVSSTIRVEWILEDAAGDGVIASAAIEPIPDWRWSLGLPKIRCRPGRCGFRISGTEPHTLESSAWRVILGPPGVVTGTTED